MTQSNLCIHVYEMMEVNQVQKSFKAEDLDPMEYLLTAFLWGNRY